MRKVLQKEAQQFQASGGQEQIQSVTKHFDLYHNSQVDIIILSTKFTKYFENKSRLCKILDNIIHWLENGIETHDWHETILFCINPLAERIEGIVTQLETQAAELQAIQSTLSPMGSAMSKIEAQSENIAENTHCSSLNVMLRTISLVKLSLRLDEKAFEPYLE